jgi:hypothetical protein
MLTDWKTIYNLKVFGSKKIKELKKRMAKIGKTKVTCFRGR